VVEDKEGEGECGLAYKVFERAFGQRMEVDSTVPLKAGYIVEMRDATLASLRPQS
jgi:hypothetical protein